MKNITLNLIILFFFKFSISYCQILDIPKIINYGVPDDPKPLTAIHEYKSTDFSVRARVGSGAWNNIFVYKTRVNSNNTPGEMQTTESSFTYFDFTGSNVEIEVTSDTIATTLIRPISKNITANLSGNTATFFLNGPANLSFEINGDRYKNLQIFVGRPIKQPDDSVNIFDIVDTLDCTPFNDDREGKWICPADSTTIWIPGGKVYEGSIHIKNKDSVRIMGRGIISQLLKDHIHSPDTLQHPSDYGWMNGITIDNSTNIRIEGIIINDTQQILVQLLQSHDITIKDIKGFTSVWGGDGIHNVASSEVDIENCFLRTSDDAISIYPFRWRNWKTYYGNVKNITVKNVALYADKAHAIEIGWHGIYDGFDGLNTTDSLDNHINYLTTKAVVENINFENIDILEQDQTEIYGDSGLFMGAIGINCGDNNYCQFINFKNINIEPFTHGSLFRIKVEPGNGLDGAAKSSGYRTQNINFTNLTYYRGAVNPNEHCSQIMGLNECRYVSNVKFTNFNIIDEYNNTIPVTTSNPYSKLNINEFAYDVAFDENISYSTLYEGRYSIENLFTSRTLDKTTEVFDDGDPMNIPNLNETYVVTSQFGGEWDLVKLSSNPDTYKFISVFNGRALTLADQGVYYGGICYDYFVTTKPYNINSNLQKWRILPVDGGYRIVSATGYGYSLGTTPIPFTYGNTYVMALPWLHHYSSTSPSPELETYQTWNFTPVTVPYSNKNGLTYTEEENFKFYKSNNQKKVFIIKSQITDRYSITVYDIQGRKVSNKSFIGKENSIDLSPLSSGIYIATIFYENEIYFNKKFLIE